jgi:hypothetical protein
MNKIIKYHSVPEYLIALTLTIFLIAWILVFRQNIIDLNEIHDIRLTFLGGLKLLYYSNNLISISLIFLAVGGFFLKNTFGRILLLSFFYFTIFDWTFAAMSDYFFLHYLALLIPLISICIVNLKSVRLSYSSVKISSLTMNLICIVISLLFTYIKGYFQLHYGKGIFEIIHLIK